MNRISMPEQFNLLTKIQYVISILIILPDNLMVFVDWLIDWFYLGIKMYMYNTR